MFEKISRRKALAAAVGAAASVPIVHVQAAGHPPAFSFTHDCDLELLELRHAIDAYQAAVRYEMSIEGQPGHAAAIVESDVRQRIVEALVEAIHERTPTSMRDIALRAEALRQWFFGGHQESLNEAPDNIGPDYCFAKLYEAAVVLTGGSDA